MKEKLTSNIGLKIISVLFAVLLWFLVVNALDPIETFTVSNIEVEILNPEAITAQSKTFTVTSPQTISITLEAKNSDRKSISASDFHAYVDMRYSYGVEEKNQAARIQIEVVDHKNIIDSDTIKIRSGDVMYFTTEDIIKRTLNVEIEEEGELDENYRLNGLEAVPSTITVTAPESLMGRVNRVVARVNRSEFSSDNTQITVAPVVLDANDNEIKSDEMKLSAEEILVSATVLRTKTITISADQTTGSAASGYQCTGIIMEPETLTVVGSRNALANVNHLLIPASELDLNNASSDVVKMVDLTGYLPEGVTFLDGAGTVKVTLRVEQLQSKVYRIPRDQILFENENERYEYRIASSYIPATIIALREDLNALTADSLQGMIDVAGLEAGTHSVKVTVPLENGYQLSDTVYAEVVVSEAAAEPEPSGSTEASDPSSETESSSSEAGNASGQ